MCSARLLGKARTSSSEVRAAGASLLILRGSFIAAKVGVFITVSNSHAGCIHLSPFITLKRSLRETLCSLRVALNHDGEEHH